MKIPNDSRCVYYFEEICKYPHGSYNEKQLSDYLVEFAKQHNLRYIQDEMYNVVIYKDGSKGFENSAPVLIQAHMDMVDEKNSDSSHDFSKDPIDIRLEDGWIYANKTTLGADDGHGVAYMLGILEDTSLVHPPIECCFTVQEEVGLFGASNLKKEYFKARNYICLDGGGEYTTLISSAGGRRAFITKSYQQSNKEGTVYTMKIRGLKGGHSGGNIDKELGNSNKLANRILYHVQKDCDIQLVSINGGLKDNAIPRECDVVFVSNSDKVEDIIRQQEVSIKTMLEFSDAGFYVELNKEQGSKEAFSTQDSKSIINAMYIMPNGLLSKSMRIPGLTLTSLNMGVVETKGNQIEIHYSLRSAINESIDEMAYQLEEICKLYNMNVEFDASYPGWNFREENPLRDKLCEVFKNIYGYEMKTVAAHGGCECGIFDSLLHPVNIISYGPIAENVHTPEERLNLESFVRCYEVLKELLTKLV